MGVLLGFGLIFGIVAILYGSNKLLLLGCVLFLIIYSIVKKTRKQPRGKIFTVFLIIAIVLQAITLPFEVFAVCAGISGKIKEKKAREELPNRDCAIIADTDSNTFTYKGVEYIELTSHLTDLEGNDDFQAYIGNSKKFDVFKYIVIEDTLNEEKLYQLKNAVDNRILYDRYWHNIWCVKTEFEAAKQTYNDRVNYNYYITYKKDGETVEKPIEQSVYEQIYMCDKKYEEDDLSVFYDIDKKSKNGTKVEVYALSKDGRVLIEKMCSNLVFIDSELYFTCYNSNLGYKFAVNDD